ncbi:uncharacterized protein LY89DRAFT_739805 [Mollisia scopiformis]|uniref:Uncharacterized protein n=1 Tax=Mollisia scopiformis TaxID=149040 RepID=A0A194WT72_MOLSC|nr:uncharacterized protein LY89DRAFT_739805 [Mollisia scopiformis]KUJ10817.1 hypothetical protein LY89DRAFT_739805 [Mollisia scopiformis]
MFCHNFLNRTTAFLIFLTSTSALTIQNILWNIPNGNLSSLSQTFTSSQTLPLSWNAWDSTQYVDTTKNLVDLWATAFDYNLNPFSQRLTVGINLTSAGNFAWTIAIPTSNLTFDAKYVLRFKVTSPIYDASSGELSSPGFLVLAASSTSTSASTSSFVPSTINTSTLMPTDTTSTTPAALGLSVGAKGGIGAGVVVAVLVVGGVLWFFPLVRRRGKARVVPTQPLFDERNNDDGPAEMPVKSTHVVELPAG